mmetsp:Transcript_6007/g.17532  ORF Transcript_6007/g.17532 Transcript_6007/m.17532 type:complete len:943 (+) Transcript_6007:937-3765(+)
MPSYGNQTDPSTIDGSRDFSAIMGDEELDELREMNGVENQLPEDTSTFGFASVTSSITRETLAGESGRYTSAGRGARDVETPAVEGYDMEDKIHTYGGGAAASESPSVEKSPSNTTDDDSDGAQAKETDGGFQNEKQNEAVMEEANAAAKQRKKRLYFIGAGVLVVAIVLIAVGVAISKKGDDGGGGGSEGRRSVPVRGRGDCDCGGYGSGATVRPVRARRYFVLPSVGHLQDPLAPHVRRHDEDGVLEADGPSLPVRQGAVLHDLEENVEHVPVSLLHLVEQDEGMRGAADGLRQLAALVVSDISRRRTRETADGMLLHVFRHIDADHILLVSEVRLGEGLAQFRLADARRTRKQKTRHGPRPISQAGPRPPHRPRYRPHRPALPLDPLGQFSLQYQEAIRLLGLQFTHGDRRPSRYDVGDGMLGHPRPILLFRGRSAAHGVRLERRLHLYHRPGLVQQIQSLIGQESIGHVSFAQFRRRLQTLGSVSNLVMSAVFRSDRAQYAHGILDARLLHGDGLEATLQCGVLLDVLSIFRDGRGSDDLKLPPGQCGLEKVGRVDPALGRSGPDEGVYLVDEQHGGRTVLVGHLLHDRLEALLEFSPILGPRHEIRELEADHPMSPQSGGAHPGQFRYPSNLVRVHEFAVVVPVVNVVGPTEHVGGGEYLSDALGDGRLSHAGLADQARIILPAADECAHARRDDVVTAVHLVQFAVARQFGQILSAFLQSGSGAVPSSAHSRDQFGSSSTALLHVPEQRAAEFARPERVGIHAVGAQYHRQCALGESVVVHGGGGAQSSFLGRIEFQQRQQDVLGADGRRIGPVGQLGRFGQDSLEAGGEGQFDVPGLAIHVEHGPQSSTSSSTAALPLAISPVLALGEHSRYRLLHLAGRNAVSIQRPPRILGTIDHPQRHDFGPHRRLAQSRRFVLGGDECSDRLLGHSIEQHR